MFCFELKDEFFKINCDVLSILAETLLLEAGRISHCFSNCEHLQEKDHNYDKFYDDCEYAGRVILNNRKNSRKDLLNKTISIINTWETTYCDDSCEFNDVLKAIKDSLYFFVSDSNYDAKRRDFCLDFLNRHIEVAKKIALRFIGKAPFNNPPFLEGRVSIKKNSCAFIESIKKNNHPFPTTDYAIRLNVINNSFVKKPLSHFMAIDIIFLHEFLAHIYAFSDRIRYFSEGVMRYTPYKYYRIENGANHGAIKCFKRINENDFLSDNYSDAAYHGFIFSQDLCEGFINVNSFFKLIRLMSFEALEHKNFASVEEYDGDVILGIIQELKRILPLGGSNGTIEMIINQSKKFDDLLSLLRENLV